jgi:hypothetical protein
MFSNEVCISSTDEERDELGFFFGPSVSVLMSCVCAYVHVCVCVCVCMYVCVCLLTHMLFIFVILILFRILLITYCFSLCYSNSLLQLMFCILNLCRFPSPDWVKATWRTITQSYSFLAFLHWFSFNCG